MNHKRPLVVAVLFVAALFASACLSLTPANQNPAEVIETSAAQTVEAYKTQSFFQTLIAQGTQAVNPVTVVVPVTVTALPPTLTPYRPTSTPLPPCNWVQFVKDITIPDDTTLSPNEGFTKTWRLRNIGLCTWTPGYDLIFTGGNSMSAPAVVDINQTVYPGDSADFSISFTAPPTNGSYVGYWQLRSSDGLSFGWGSQANNAFWVKINVGGSEVKADSSKLVDFAYTYCNAKWSSTTKSSMSCPTGALDFHNGSITRSYSPRIEKDYQDDEGTIIMVPPNGSGGYIQGRFPPVLIQDGDRFVALTGCLASSPACNVMFQLNYSANGNAVESFSSWNEAFDGDHTHVNIDLSSLAGKSVELILLVHNNGDSEDDRAFWMAPGIVR